MAGRIAARFRAVEFETEADAVVAVGRRIRAGNIGLLSDVATAFLFASARRRGDMRALLAQIQ